MGVVFLADDVFGSALCDEQTTTAAPFRPHIKQPVGFGNDVQIVLDDHDGVARFHQTMKDNDELFNIGHR